MRSSARLSSVIILSSLVWSPVVASAPTAAGQDAVASPAAATTADANGSGTEVVSFSLPKDAGRAEADASELKRGVAMLRFAGGQATPSYTTMLPVGRHRAKVPVQAIKVDEGRVDAIVPDEGGQKGVMLQGPQRIVGIATEGRLSMVITETTIVLAVLEGEVLLGQGGRFRDLKEGELVRFNRRTGEKIEKSTLPRAPQLSLDSRLAPDVGGPSSVRLSVKADSKKIRTIVFDQEGERVESSTSDSTAPLSVRLPGPGSYRIVSRALDESGIAGPLSEPVSVEVLGVKAGSAAQHRGVYLLAPDERLELMGTQGLEMRYGGAGPFIPALAKVGLTEQQKEVMIQFRDPSDPTTVASLRLAPRIARARIELGPGLATWPQDPVHMSIRLRDGVGRAIPVDDRYEVRTRINLEDIDVDWTKKDGALTATVPPQRGTGPWVVRVVVKDEHGREVGRGHLEVIHEAPAPIPEGRR